MTRERPESSAQPVEDPLSLDYPEGWPATVAAADEAVVDPGVREWRREPDPALK